MQKITSIAELRQIIGELKKNNLRINFVPTMGFLHAGHRQLIREALPTCDILVVSIFINPLQFAPHEDLANYPCDLDGDSQLCQASLVDILFTPPASEMLGLRPQLTMVKVSHLDDYLCGASRPGHFAGVCSIVSKLLNLVQPDKLFLGKKDIQQYRIVQQMVDDLNYPVEVVGVETVRAEDGLALSSRNSYLTPQERKLAPVLFESLNWIATKIVSGESREDILALASTKLSAMPALRIDYFEIVDYYQLAPTADFQQPLVIAGAIFIANTRLIDNLVLNMPGG